MAHPYAPMGGSYDDRVVGIVVDEFLKAGWIVGTFNFRYDLASLSQSTPN
jgi:alpha/beta superfamily hydrolase